MCVVLRLMVPLMVLLIFLFVGLYVLARKDNHKFKNAKPLVHPRRVRILETCMCENLKTRLI